MKIYSKSELLTKEAPSTYFTGSVKFTPIVDAPEPSRLKALTVRFSAGARTHWHTHPLGQTLHVVEGRGLIQKRGEAANLISAGDTVWIPPGVEHWHGAVSTAPMVHIAMQEKKDGTDADWLEAVNDADYQASHTV